MSLSHEHLTGRALAALIAHKARKFANGNGLRLHDVEDLRQDLYLHVLKQAHHYDSTRGVPGAFLAQVVGRKLTHIAEARVAQCRDVRRLVHPRDPDRLSMWSPAVYTDVDARLDIDAAIEALPPQVRTLAVTLKTLRLSEAARRIGLSRGRARQQLARLRRHFMTHRIKSSYRLTAKARSISVSRS